MRNIRLRSVYVKTIIRICLAAQSYVDKFDGVSPSTAWGADGVSGCHGTQDSALRGVALEKRAAYARARTDECPCECVRTARRPVERGTRRDGGGSVAPCRRGRITRSPPALSLAGSTCGSGPIYWPRRCAETAFQPASGSRQGLGSCGVRSTDGRPSAEGRGVRSAEGRRCGAPLSEQPRPNTGTTRPCRGPSWRRLRKLSPQGRRGGRCAGRFRGRIPRPPRYPSC
jgi:hypothetical protein